MDNSVSMNPADYPALASSEGGIKMMVFAAVFWVLAAITIVLRIWSRVLKSTPLAFNDYAVFVAFVFASALTAITITSVAWAGSGHHMSDIAPPYRSRTFVVFAAGQPTWAASNTFVKFSILHLYIVLFPGRTFRYVCIGTMVFSGLYFTSVLLETFLLCTPVQFNWDKTITTGTCSPHNLAAYIIAGSTNLVIDFFIVVLPMPSLWNLRISWPKKICVMAMFSLGALICVITLLRVINIARLDLIDFPFASINLSIWSTLEPSLGIINASLPVLRPIGSSVSKSPVFTWAKSSFRSLGTSRTGKRTVDSMKVSGGTSSRGDRFQKLADPTDQLYQLDTIHLVGNGDGGSATTRED